MSFKRLDFAHHRGAYNKFTYTLNWTQILLILFKRPNKLSYKDVEAPRTNRFWDKKCALCVPNLTSTQDVLQASRFLRLAHNILKNMSQCDIVVI